MFVTRLPSPPCRDVLGVERRGKRSWIIPFNKAKCKTSNRMRAIRAGTKVDKAMLKGAKPHLARSPERANEMVAHIMVVQVVNSKGPQILQLT